MTNPNSIYWAFNIPLQVWAVRQDEENKDSPITGYRVLNYAPRKSTCSTIDSSDFKDLLKEQTPEEFFNNAAEKLEALAKKFRQMANKEIDHIYYPD